MQVTCPRHPLLAKISSKRYSMVYLIAGGSIRKKIYTLTIYYCCAATVKVALDTAQKKKQRKTSFLKNLSFYLYSL